MSEKIVVAKDGVNVLHETDPENLKFSSDYGTLKYFQKINKILTFDASAAEVGAKGTYTHNLNYYPFVQAFVRVYIGSPSGNYEPCPFAGSGAAVSYDATFAVTPTDIEVYGQIHGVSTSVWTFDFLLFLYKNNLQL